MCQLNYLNLLEMYRNSVAAYFLATIGSDRHKDGCGMICTGNKIWKSHHPAKIISNLGEILYQNVTDDNPFPFHIRLATWGIEVKKENSHPFDGKHFILMHNGTLVDAKEVEGTVVKDKKKDSDSAKFLKALDSAKDKNPEADFPAIFNIAMEKFAGKFAFIIRDKETNTDYIIRGRTAELWISKYKFAGEASGYIVNTSKDTIDAATHQISNIVSIYDGKENSFSKPELLKQETIYIAEKDGLREIGKTLEKDPPKKEEKKVFESGQQLPAVIGSREDDKVLVRSIIKYADRIFDFLSGHSLTLLDLQMMIQYIAKISLREVTEEDISMFVDHIIPKFSVDKPLRSSVKAALGGKSFPHTLYKMYNLEYPWMLNNKEDINKALTEYAKLQQ